MLHLRRRSQTLTVHLFGGLGNQLFQIAAGLKIAEISGQQLVVTIKSSLAGKFLRDADYDLIEAFLPRTKIIQNESNNSAIWLRLLNYLFRKSPLFQKVLRIHSPKEVGYPADIEKQAWNELRGHYQTYIYANGLAERLRNLELSKSQWFESKYAEIKSEPNSVALHFRRGDYVTLSNQYGLLTTEYFSSTISENFQHLTDVKIYIFSDEPRTAELQFGSIFPNAEVLKPPKESTAFESMLLMASCKNIVLSNSTFSWWAGMINTGDGLIIAPEPWMKNGVVINELIPPHWRRSSAIWES